MIAKKDYVIPVIFHNLYNYDIHLLIKSLVRRMPRIRLIAKTEEHYVCGIFYVPKTYVRFMFLDSMKFTSGSLSNLAKLLQPEDKQLIKDEFPEHHSLLMGKLCYPCEFCSDWSILEQTELPPIEEFYSKLTEESITQTEYEQTKLLWKTLGIKNIGELSDIYLKIDVLLLVCVLEKFRKDCLKIHKLDPCYYITLPGFSWDAMLKYTKCKIKLLKNSEQENFIKRGIRGGFSCAIKKYAKSNNEFVPNFNPDLPTTHLIYLDLNNLYGGENSETSIFFYTTMLIN